MIRKRKRGVTGLEVFGPNYTFKASTVYDYLDMIGQFNISDPLTYTT